MLYYSIIFCVFFVNSPDGYLYEKQAILEYILHQKKEIAKKMKVSSNISGYRTLTTLKWGVPSCWCTMKDRTFPW